MKIKLNKWRGQRGWTALLGIGKKVIAGKIAGAVGGKLGQGAGGMVGGLMGGGGGTGGANAGAGALAPGQGLAQQEMGKQVGLLGGGGNAEEAMATDNSFTEGLMNESPPPQDPVPTAPAVQGGMAPQGPQEQPPFTLDGFLADLMKQNNGMGLQSDLPQFDWSQLWR